MYVLGHLYKQVQDWHGDNGDNGDNLNNYVGEPAVCGVMVVVICN